MVTGNISVLCKISAEALTVAALLLSRDKKNKMIQQVEIKRAAEPDYLITYLGSEDESDHKPERL